MTGRFLLQEHVKFSLQNLRCTARFFAVPGCSALGACFVCGHAQMLACSVWTSVHARAHVVMWHWQSCSLTDPADHGWCCQCISNTHCHNIFARNTKLKIGSRCFFWCDLGPYWVAWYLSYASCDKLNLLLPANRFMALDCSTNWLSYISQPTFSQFLVCLTARHHDSDVSEAHHESDPGYEWLWVITEQVVTHDILHSHMVAKLMQNKIIISMLW